MMQSKEGQLDSSVTRP
nr:unnamed protein product [Callosobruchus chinensis]